MRILVTVPLAERLGGSEEMLQTALDGAAAAGHEFDLVFFEAGPWPEELERTGFHVEVLAAGRLRQPHKLLATIVRLAKIMRARQPDLILNWLPKTHVYGAPAAILAGMKGRLVWWQHSIPRPDGIDRCATLLPAAAVGCSSGACARAQERVWPLRPTFVVTPGTRVPERAGTDSEAPAPRAVRAVPEVGLVGRLQPWKGQDRLLEAHAILRGRGHRLHTLIVGGDAHGFSPEYASSLPALISRLGLEDEVTMTGQVPDAGPFIDRMDVLVNASDPPEPFGIVLLEGMARGVAVVAIDSGAPGEFIDDGLTGVLARSGDPVALADALERVLQSPELRHGVAERGHELFMREYTDVAMWKRFYGELERLVAERGAAA
jgi:glycosyltransferase involved in cell wall biosynthesis